VEARRHDGCRRRQERDEHVGGIEAALVGGAEDTREDFLAVSPAASAIATAAHFAGHDGRPQRVFGAPIGRIKGRIKEKAEDGVEFDDEMLLKAAHAQPTTGRPPEQAAEPLDAVTAGNGETLRRDRAGAVVVSGCERTLQDRFYRRDTRLVRVVQEQGATAPQQMRETTSDVPPA
jgi:hypothetical protein